jgi:hypothetical protein
MSRSGPRPHPRGQSGISLVELLLVLLLTGMLFGPLTAWWILAEQSQPQIQADSSRISSTALLSQYLVRDVAVAAAAANPSTNLVGAPFNFQDCRGGSAEGGTVKLVLLRGGLAALTKTVYTEVDAGGSIAMWRRTCTNSDGQNTAETQVADGLEAGSTASCTDGGDGSVCRTVALTVTPDGGVPVVVRGVRRVDVATLDSGATGARTPIAKITVASQTFERPYEVVFSADTSSDPDGAILCYQWAFTTIAEGRTGAPAPAYVNVEDVPPDRDPSLGSPCTPRALPPGVVDTPGSPGDQQRTFATSGIYFVELTVTDDTGLTSTDYLRFEIAPLDPVAESRITALGGGTATAGETVFEFAARWDEPAGVPLEGSRHPDGNIDRYVWTLTEGSDIAYRVERTSPDPWYLALPAEMAGSVSVTLTVHDDEQQRQATYVNGVTLAEPAVGTTLPLTTTWVPGAHQPPSNVRVGGPTPASDTALVRWNAAPQADRYIIESSGAGCTPTVTSLRVVPAGVLSAPLLPAGCLNATTLQVRIGAEFGGAVSWSSPPVTYTVPAVRIDPSTLEGGS